jgi:hypothetical protein
MGEPENFGQILVGAAYAAAVRKPMFRKPFVQVSHGVALGGQLFQDASVLTARFRDYGDVFIGQFATDVANAGKFSGFLRGEMIQGLKEEIREGDSFLLVVLRNFASRAGWSGDPWGFVTRHGGEKLPAHLVDELAGMGIFRGAALGLYDPALVRAMYEAQYGDRDPEMWKLAHDSGLDIPEKPDFKAYEDAEAELVEMFGGFLAQWRPELRAEFGFSS